MWLGVLVFGDLRCKILNLNEFEWCMFIFDYYFESEGV